MGWDLPDDLRRGLHPARGRRLRRVPRATRRHPGMRQPANDLRGCAAVRGVLLRRRRFHGVRRRRRRPARRARPRVRRGHDRHRARPRVRPRHPVAHRRTRSGLADDHDRTAGRLLRRRMDRARRSRRSHDGAVQRRRRSRRADRHDQGERSGRRRPVRGRRARVGVRPRGRLPGRLQSGTRTVLASCSTSRCP